jgi:DNA polymerase-1
VPLSEVTSDLRRKAKAVNFGIIYGISAFGLSAQLKTTQAEAKYYIDTYFQRLPQVKTYMQQTINFARDKGYVVTPFGRKIWIKDINSKNYSARAFSERAAINAPLQGAAADCIKYAMIDVDKMIAVNYPEIKILSQVHDELLFEVPSIFIDSFKKELQSIMQQAPLNYVNLSVPLIVEVGQGVNWREAH